MSDLQRAVSALEREDRRSADATALVGWVDDVAPEATTPPELLALTVGRAYGIAVAERDQARNATMALSDTLLQATRHLAIVLELVPVSSFASANDDVTKARAWLADHLGVTHVDSSESPEQESP